MSVKLICSAMAKKQGNLSMFNFKPLTEEDKVVKAAITKHRREVDAEMRTQKAIEEEQQERERENKNVDDEAVEVIVNSTAVVATTRKKEPRPHNWEEIALEYISASKKHRLKHVIDRFKLGVNMANCISYWTMTLSRWANDLKANKILKCKRGSSIPLAVEKSLVQEVSRYNNAGVPLTNMILRMNLVLLMKAAGLEYQISVPNSFGDSWFQRFYARHNISSRVATTKMREDIPADFDAKRAKYVALLSISIHDHNVPDELIMGVDETNAQFVPSVKKTRAMKGTKRIRVIGVGKEKPQITTTFGGTVSGELLPKTQLIFGGKTVNCHPNKGKTAAPDGLYYDHTASHWQNDETYLSYIKEVIVPYRLAVIQRLGLPDDQKCILIHDLHYSHQGDAVRDYCKANNIILIFVPAGCTDIMQMCDVALNKVFKNGLSVAFVQYVNDMFIEHTTKNPGVIFSLNLALSVLKPLLPKFVKAGIAAMSTTAMKDVIRKCFLNHGLVAEARTPRALTTARELLAVDNTPIVGEELESDLGPLDEGDIDGDQEFLIDTTDANEDENVEEVNPTQAVVPTPDVPAPPVTVNIKGGNNNTYNVNIHNNVTVHPRPSYAYEVVTDEWNDGGMVDNGNVVNGKRRRIAKSYE
jgi:hypothetical protein